MGIYIFVLYYKIMVKLLFKGLDIFTCHLFAHLCLCVCGQDTEGVRIYCLSVTSSAPGFTHAYHCVCVPLIHHCICVRHTLLMRRWSLTDHLLVLSWNHPHSVHCAFTRPPDSYQSAMMLIFNIGKVYVKKHPWSFISFLPSADYCSIITHTHKPWFVNQDDASCMWFVWH